MIALCRLRLSGKSHTAECSSRRYGIVPYLLMDTQTKTTHGEGTSAMLVKHSKRTVRKPCKQCGRTGLYWAHETDLFGDRCADCEVSGKWVLIEQDGTRHQCTGVPRNSPEVNAEPVTDPFGDDDPLPTESSPETVTTPSAPETAGGAFAAFQALMDAMAPKVDREEVAVMIKEELSHVTFPTRTVTERASGETVTIDGAHEKLSDVVMDLLAGEHVMMVGPAGTGKGTIAEHAAESLGLPYYSISLNPLTPRSEIMGYNQAAGVHIRSLFREAFEHGGVFHFDEIDNSHPSALGVINAALSNGRVAFPDGMVKRHPDFRCVASANTYGRGPDRAYVGRQQIDAATLDRFTVETINVDEALETELCHATGLPDAQANGVLAYIRRLRRNAEVRGMTVVVSPRASVGMCRLLGAGKTWEAAVESRVRRGMSDQDWAKLCA